MESTIRSSSSLRSQRRGEDELGAGMAWDHGQRRIQLFGERADHAGAKSFPTAYFEAFGKTAAFVANRN
jgi:hypothetical protein